jgi:hypothetical protein
VKDHSRRLQRKVPQRKKRLSLQANVDARLRSLPKSRFSCRNVLYPTGLAALPAERYAQTPLIGRIWELRHNFTAHDAIYIALAEATDSVLYTCDEKLRSGIKPGSSYSRRDRAEVLWAHTGRTGLVRVSFG